MVCIMFIAHTISECPQAFNVCSPDAYDSSLLESYLAVGDRRALLDNAHRHKACLRGYQAQWEIREERLFLTQVDGYFDADDCYQGQRRSQTLQDIFPGTSGDIHAD